MLIFLICVICAIGVIISVTRAPNVPLPEDFWPTRIGLIRMAVVILGAAVVTLLNLRILPIAAATAHLPEHGDTHAIGAQRAIDAVKGHRRFGFNYDPSHLGYQGVDYVKFIRAFPTRIFHSHIKDAWWGHGNGDVGVFGGHTTFGDHRRFWDFRSPGRGDIKFEEIIVALNDIAYRGPLSVEWEDIRMDRIHGATEAAAFVRKIDFPTSNVAFDAAFDKAKQ